MTSMPIDPPADAIPSAMLRHSSATLRPTDASTIEKPQPAMPTPTSNPALIWAASGVVAYPMITVPAAYNKAPPTMTRPDPYLSAIMPANGCAIPHSKFCNAIENANTSRDHPRSVDSGCRKMPKLERMPNDRSKIIPPQITTAEVPTRKTDIRFSLFHAPTGYNRSLHPITVRCRHRYTPVYLAAKTSFGYFPPNSMTVRAGL